MMRLLLSCVTDSAQFEFHRLALCSSLWETEGMTNKKTELPHEERRAKQLLDKIAKKKKSPKPQKEDFSQAAARIVREATKE
jgi:hypothetical protein